MCDSLRQASRAVTRIYDDALRPAEIRITQFVVLTHLHEEIEARVRDLAARLFLEETTLTRSLGVLEERGWVKSRAGRDRRERLVSITQAGRQLLVRARPLWQGAEDELREHVSASAWDSLLRALPKLASATGPLTSND